MEGGAGGAPQTRSEGDVENCTNRLGCEWKSSRGGILRLPPLAPPTASILLRRGADALPDPQACLRLLFTAADVIAAHRCGRRTNRRSREGRVLICEDCEGIIIITIIIILILHIVEFSLSGKKKIGSAAEV